jgi:hypothetical protein
VAAPTGRNKWIGARAKDTWKGQQLAALTQTSEGYGAALQEVAIGEALFASTLATVMLTYQVATGLISHDEVSALLDGATLMLERHRGSIPDNTGAVDHARSRLSALMKVLDQMGRSRPVPADAG